jgi:predicted signal transduction protein with EAL and GGDEF domain
MRHLKCTYGQGFYFARPLVADEVPDAARAAEVTMSEAAARAEAAGERRAAAEVARRGRSPRGGARSSPAAVAVEGTAA